MSRNHPQHSQHKTHDVNVHALVPLFSPQELKDEVPSTSAIDEQVYDAREVIKQILNGSDPRLLMIVGPCSIHDPKSALEYAERLSKLRKKVKDKVFLVMRVYFEKPRTTIGWKGLINDPNLDNSFDIKGGLKIARKLLLQINQLGLPVASEMLDTIIPQYLADLISWASIGARTTESQPHREMSSGLSMPVGFKNGTDGNLEVAINGMKAATHEHCFIGINQKGELCSVRTKGNPWVHLILRGGQSLTNYDAKSVGQAAEKLNSVGVTQKMIIDCSHDNSRKKYENQSKALSDVLEQLKGGSQFIGGVMLESNLHAGNQPLPKDLSELKYGVSITDQCMGWEETERLVRHVFTNR